MHSDQRGGAGRLHVDARASEIQFVGDTRGQEILIIIQVTNQPSADGFHDLPILKQVMHQVVIGARPAIYSNGPIKRLRVISGVFQRLPGAFQKHAMLRIHDRGIPRAEPKEGRIKPIHVVQFGYRRNEVGVLNALLAHAGLA